METQKVQLEPTFDFVIPSHVLDDLSCRFIINVPSQEKKDLVRICFQIEQAHWFYLDFYSIKFNDTLRPCSLKEFARNIFYHIRYLRPFIKDLDVIIDDWKEYKYSVPTFGAIIVDEESKQILLVKSYWSKSSWGFPKGKINKDETPCHCAAREVYEETGFNISSLIHPEIYVETIINDQCIRLYIVSGVSRNTKFTPQTRNEIKEIKWFPIDSIPIKKTKVKNKLNGSFYMVIPFMRDLRKWILQNGVPKLSKQRFKSFSEVEDLLYATSVEGNNTSQLITDFSPLSKDNQPNQKIIFDIPGNEVECYEGSDEDDVKKSNEEIYGIPKVKSIINGKDLDSYLLTCSDMSYMKKNRTKNNVDPNQMADKDIFRPTVLDSEASMFIKTNLEDKFVNNIEKNMRSAALDKNLNLENHNNCKNSAYHLHSLLNNSTMKYNPEKNVYSFNSTEKNSLISNQRISNHLNSLPKHENDAKSQNYVKNNDPLPISKFFSKTEFIDRLNASKAVQAMKSFKFNRESLLKSLE